MTASTRRLTALGLGLGFGLAMVAALPVPAAPQPATPQPTAAQPAAHYFLYVGGYGTSIHAYRFTPATGTLQALPQTAPASSPSFLAADPAHHSLYAVSEADPGAVLAFRLDRSTGALTPLNTRPSGGPSPCHLAVDATGKMLLVANYGSGSVSSYTIEPDGRLSAMTGQVSVAGHGPVRGRQDGPHAHEAVFSADNRFVYVPDLGLDEIRIYRADAGNASLQTNAPAVARSLAGSGPRHLVLSHDGRFAYVVHELEAQVSVFSRDLATGALNPLQIIATVAAPSAASPAAGISDERSGGSVAPAEIALDARGRHLYVSNRYVLRPGQHAMGVTGSITVFDVDAGSGELSRRQVIAAPGRMPRAMALDPGGRLLLVGDQQTNRFALYAVDAGNGRLTPTGRSFDTPSPASFLFVPAQ